MAKSKENSEDKLSTKTANLEAKPTKKAESVKDSSSLDTISPTGQQEKTTSNKKTERKSSSGTTAVVIVLLGIFLIICCCLLACAGVMFSFVFAAAEESETSTGTEVTPFPEENPTITNADIGDTEVVGDWRVTLEDVDIESGTWADTYVVELTIENLSNSDNSFSTFSQLELVGDNGEIYFRDYGYIVNRPLNGFVEAGESKKGEIAYSVDDNPDQITLEVSDSIFATEVISFRIK